MTIANSLGGMPLIVPNDVLGEVVNPRELHEFLESKQQFADWIKKRIEKYKFIDSENYLVHKFMMGENTGFERIDYLLSVDMQKKFVCWEPTKKFKWQGGITLLVTHNYTMYNFSNNSIIK